MKTKTAPRTATPEALAKYGTTIHNCNCPDRVNRGGSHIDPIQQDSVCYHMLTKREQVRAGQAAPAKAPLVGSWKTIDGIQVYTLDETPAQVAPAQAAPAAKAAESLAALRSRRADLETQLEEVSYRLDMLQPRDEWESENANYFIIGSLMSEIDDIMGDLEALDRKIAQAVQAEAVAEAELQTEIETAQADQEFAALIAEINDDLDDQLSLEELESLMATRKTERKLGGPARRCMDRSGILEPAKPTSATDALLAAISPQLQGSPIRRHG